VRYVSVDEGRRADGLRLVLSKGLPGPWGVAAKAIVDIKRLDYLALAQEVGAENAELRAWTGQVSAPVLAWNDEPPCTDSLEILFLAERLAPSPRLIPEDVAERVRMFGIAREIIGRQGLGWERRVMLLAPIVQAGQADAGAQAMASRYGCVEASAERASGEVVRIVSFLARELRAQLARGSRYFVGDALSAADLYWAAFSLMLQPLPDSECPMPEYMRHAYSATNPEIAAALRPELLAHRDFVFRGHIGLPVDFRATSD